MVIRVACMVVAVGAQHNRNLLSHLPPRKGKRGALPSSKRRAPLSILGMSAYLFTVGTTPRCGYAQSKPNCR